jgi:hypothetical protein
MVLLGAVFTALVAVQARLQAERAQRAEAKQRLEAESAEAEAKATPGNYM